MIKKRLLQMENIVTITLLYLTLLGNIEMTLSKSHRKKVVSLGFKDNVKVQENKQRTLFSGHVYHLYDGKQLLDIFVEMIHHNN